MSYYFDHPWLKEPYSHCVPVSRLLSTKSSKPSTRHTRDHLPLLVLRFCDAMFLFIWRLSQVCSPIQMLRIAYSVGVLRSSWWMSLSLISRGCRDSRVLPHSGSSSSLYVFWILWSVMYHSWIGRFIEHGLDLVLAWLASEEALGLRICTLICNLWGPFIFLWIIVLFQIDVMDSSIFWPSWQMHREVPSN